MTIHRNHFTTSDDINVFFLRYVTARDPLEYSALRKAVANALSDAAKRDSFLQAVRGRVELLLKIFEAGDPIKVSTSRYRAARTDKAFSKTAHSPLTVGPSVFLGSPTDRRMRAIRFSVLLKEANVWLKKWFLFCAVMSR